MTYSNKNTIAIIVIFSKRYFSVNERDEIGEAMDSDLRRIKNAVEELFKITYTLSR